MRLGAQDLHRGRARRLEEAVGLRLLRLVGVSQWSEEPVSRKSKLC